MEKFICIIAMGCAGAYIAKKRKLNPFLWFAVCSMLGLLAILTLIFLPFFMKKFKKKATLSKKAVSTPLFPLETIWYYLDEDEEQIGPMSFARLLEVKKDGIIKESNYIWHETFSHWKQWNSVFSVEKSET